MKINGKIIHFISNSTEVSNFEDRFYFVGFTHYQSLTIANLFFNEKKLKNSKKAREETEGKSDLAHRGK